MRYRLSHWLDNIYRINKPVFQVPEQRSDKLCLKYSPYIRLLPPWPMARPPESSFVIVCKAYLHNIPAPVETMPSSWFIADCPLCGARRRYLAVDIFQGRLSRERFAKASQIANRRSYVGEMRRAIAREEQERTRGDGTEHMTGPVRFNASVRLIDHCGCTTR